MNHIKRKSSIKSLTGILKSSKSWMAQDSGQLQNTIAEWWLLWYWTI